MCALTAVRNGRTILLSQWSQNLSEIVNGISCANNSKLKFSKLREFENNISYKVSNRSQTLLRLDIGYYDLPSLEKKQRRKIQQAAF